MAAPSRCSHNAGDRSTSSLPRKTAPQQRHPGLSVLLRKARRTYSSNLIFEGADPATGGVLLNPAAPVAPQLPPQPANTAVRITSNQGDVATTMLANALSGDFQATDGIAQAPIGQDWGFGVDFSLSADATKAPAGYP